MFVIDVSRTAGEISPLWFGHNLEHTRSCLWEGLSAELIRNRKFAALPQRDGVARHWYRIGPRGCWHLLERAGGGNGVDGEAYTTHFDPKDRGARQRQRIECCRVGAPCGIGQRGICLVGGRAYEARLALVADREMPVRVRLFGGDPGRIHFETVVTVGPEGWAESSLSFTASETDEDSRLEITFDGPGVLYVGAVSLLPADHFLGMRRDVIELLKEISVPVLRWPGGNFAGDYRWKDGLLPVDRRAPLSSSPATLPHTDGYDDHEIGTDEFIALCRELGAEPFITINMSLEGPEEAAAWVEYCNGSRDTKWGKLRGERGHPGSYNVKYWTLGNEMGYGHMKGPNTPREYAEVAAACAEAMRRVDPSIALTASGGWAEEWYKGVLAPEEGYFESISYHTYTALAKVFAGEEGRREFCRLAAAPSAIFQGSGFEHRRHGDNRLTLRYVRELIDAHAPGDKFIGISFDEWNVWYAWYRTPGVGEGVYAGSMLNLFCREGGNVGMTVGAYFEPVNEGAILVGPASSRLTPVGQVFSLFRPHHGNRLIAVEPARQGDDVDLTASLDEERKCVVITLVNRSPDQSKEAGIVLRNIGAIESAEGVLLSSADYLPGSEFTQNPLEIRRKKDHVLSVSLPKHSVARIQITEARMV